MAERGKGEGERAHLREKRMAQDLLRRPAFPRGGLQDRVDEVQRFRGDFAKIAALRGAAEIAENRGDGPWKPALEANIVLSRRNADLMHGPHEMKQRRIVGVSAALEDELQFAELGVLVRGEENHAGEKLDEDASRRPDVHFGTVLGNAEKELGGTIPESNDAGGVVGDHGIVDEAREAEVGEFEVAGTGNEDVC